MGRRPGLTKNQRHEATGLFNAGQRVHDVAQYFRVQDSTISRLRQRVGLHQTGQVRHRPRSSKPRLSEDRYLVMSSRRHSFQSAANHRHYNSCSNCP